MDPSLARRLEVSREGRFLLRLPAPLQMTLVVHALAVRMIATSEELFS